MPGTWQTVTNGPPYQIDLMLLLTDGTVLCHEPDSARWARLAPDEHGEYVNPRWLPVDLMHHARQSFGACVLADGRVLVAFGTPDLSTGDRGLLGDTTIEFFDPTAPPGRQWRLRAAAPGWGAERISGTRVCALADGRRVLVGNDDGFLRSAVFNPVTNQWIPVEPFVNLYPRSHAWSLLPDGSILAVNHHPSNFRYLPDATRGHWVPAGRGVYEDSRSGGDDGAALLLPDGRVWVVGQLGIETLIYTPPTRPGEPDNWTRGPRVPEGIWAPGFDFLAGCLLPSGIVLFTGGWPNEGVFGQLFEFDPSREAEDAISQITLPDSSEVRGGRLLTLPTGQALMSSRSDMYVYTPTPETRDPQPQWRPTLRSPRMGSRLTQGRENTAAGTLFNGMSQAVCKSPNGFGQAVSGTNYPIIRLRNIESGRVWYCRTYGHSSMGVATGNVGQTTRFVIPGSVPDGEAELCIIANGIAGDCIRVEIGPPLYEMKIEEVFYTIGNLADGPYILFGPYGPIPVPPWPGPGIDKSVFKERILRAYTRILFGLLSLEELGRTNEQQQDWSNESFTKRLTVLGQIEYGLDMLRKLGDELEDSLTEKPFQNPYGK